MTKKTYILHLSKCQVFECIHLLQLDAFNHELTLLGLKVLFPYGKALSLSLELSLTFISLCLECS